MLLTETEPYSLTDPAFLEDPYPVYRRMRRQDPVYWSEGLRAWILTRYGMPQLRFDEKRPMRRRSDSLVFRGLESLPVRFD
jgi:cytochrome P450